MPVIGCGENVREIPWRLVEANHGERGLVSLGKGACALASLFEFVHWAARLIEREDYEEPV